MYKKIVVCLFILLLVHVSFETQTTIQLKSWQFYFDGQSTRYPATIPSTLAQDLIKVGLVSDDPYFRDNFLQYYKYQTRNVNYVTQFTVPKQCSNGIVRTLVFEGLDTHCSIYLNGEKILEAHNMFRRYEVNVSLPSTTNTLMIKFNSSALWDIQKAKQFYDEFDFNLPQNFSFTRKAAYQYGWDWGPRILTVGIWKPAYLQCEYQFLTEQIDNLSITLRQPITSLDPSQIDFDILVRVKYLRYEDVNRETIFNFYRQQKLFYTGSTNASPQFINDDRIRTRIVFEKRTIKNVDFKDLVWSTWDIGVPNLIKVEVIFFLSRTPEKNITKNFTVGFRTVKIIQDTDTFGKTFTINLNGQDIFMRGGNYIPPAMSMPGISSQVYQKVAQDALFARFNMIRVWGGGQYENDDFYSKMDKYGILIWHDLMFACAMYPVMPGSDDLQNIRIQIEQNVQRLILHPSIGLWNGNNQVQIGWKEWGWQNNLTNLQKYNVERMYKQIFNETIPSAISGITPNTPYWQTSPSSSSNKVDSINSGDIHFWRVWGAGTDIEQYKTYLGRFNSEYGMQSMPEISTLKKFTQTSDLVWNSSILRLHQRHPKGDQYLPMYTQAYVGQSRSEIKKYSFFSQIMQAYALQMAITSLRANKPITMGSLYWQLNDVWPVSSWSTVDYYGTYKIAHYRVRQAHEQLLVHCVHVNSSNTWRVVAINDYNSKISLFCQIKIMNFGGSILANYTVQRTVNPQQNLLLLRPNMSSFEPNSTLLTVLCRDGWTGKNYSNNYYPLKPIYRLMLNPQLSVVLVNETAIRIKVNKLANYVWIRSINENSAGNLVKNYFDVLPGEEIEVSTLPLKAINVEVSCYQFQRLNIPAVRPSPRNLMKQK